MQPGIEDVHTSYSKGKTSSEDGSETILLKPREKTFRFEIRLLTIAVESHAHLTDGQMARHAQNG